ncbi:MAG: TMEM175 family protein [Acidimicrobiales bacterium]
MTSEPLPEQRESRASETRRLEAFSDGVLAVAITFLAFNLPDLHPDPKLGSLAHQLYLHWPAGAAYLVSFLTIGIIWVNHHSVFAGLVRVDRTLLFLNLALLAFVVLIPFATMTLAGYLRERGADAHLAAALYGIVLEAMSLCFAGIFEWSMRKGHTRDRLPPEVQRNVRLRFGIGNAFYLLAIGLSFFSAPLALAIYGAVAVYYVFEHTQPNQPVPSVD